jgi:glutathione S-transferase
MNAGRLGEADWLDGAFNAGDLLMVAVLFSSKGSGILDEYANALRLCRPR